MRSLRTIVNKAPVSFAPRSFKQSSNGGTRPDKTSQLAAMGSVGTLFSIVNKTSTATASVDWHLFRKRRPGDDPDAPRERVRQHLALDVLNTPSDFYTRQAFVETFQQHLDLTGEAYWVVARDPRFDTVPLEVWPVRPDRMTPVPDPEEFLAGWVYTSPSGERVPLTLQDVVQLKMPNPLDPYRGMGPVQSVLADIDSARYSADWNRNFFLNSASPGGIIKVESSLDDRDFDRLVNRWRESHQGVNNAHAVAVLEGGMDFQESQFSMKDMQFAQLREVNREIIREAFGISKFMLGLVDDVNRATADASEAVFAKYLTVPRLERIKGALNNGYLKMFGVTGEGVEFDYCNPVPEDVEQDNSTMAARTTAYATLVGAGVNPDDAATVVGLPAMRFTERVGAGA